MGMLSERAVVGKHCTISAMHGERVLTLEGTIHGISDTVVSIDVKNIERLKHFEGAERILLNSTDKDEREYSAVDSKVLFSKKHPNIAALSSSLQVAYANNRVYPRYSYEVNTAAKLAYKHDWTQCKSLDVSQGGVALRADTTVPVGSKLDIMLYDKFKKLSIMLEAEVRHSRKLTAGSFLIGCQCVQTAELKQLVSNLAEESFDRAY